ncbi:hypothetical protein THAOC_18793, partial [Thalassiosira oceanica]
RGSARRASGPATGRTTGHRRLALHAVGAAPDAGPADKRHGRLPVPVVRVARAVQPRVGVVVLVGGAAPPEGLHRRGEAGGRRHARPDGVGRLLGHAPLGGDGRRLALPGPEDAHRPAAGVRLPDPPTEVRRGGTVPVRKGGDRTRDDDDSISAASGGAWYAPRAPQQPVHHHLLNGPAPPPLVASVGSFGSSTAATSASPKVVPLTVLDPSEGSPYAPRRALHGVEGTSPYAPRRALMGPPPPRRGQPGVAVVARRRRAARPVRERVQRGVPLARPHGRLGPERRDGGPRESTHEEPGRRPGGRSGQQRRRRERRRRRGERTGAVDVPEAQLSFAAGEFNRSESLWL